MSEAKHTPGPWHTAGEQGVQIRSKRDQIAKVLTMRGNEWKANASLIAAAPDLMAVVVAYADHFERCRITNTHGSRDFDFAGHLAALARAAIAKATAQQ